MKRLQPFWLACALLTTLPVGPLVHTPVASRDSGRSVVCYPLVGLLIGLLVSLFQAATQINEMTLSFIPKILGVFAVLIIAGPWLLSLIIDFTRTLFQNIPFLVS